MLMSLWQNDDPTRLRDDAFVNTFTKVRGPELLFGFDNSKLKDGRQQTKN